MTIFNPIWNVTINGVAVTDSVLSNLVATSGRTNIYEQAQAGYVNLELVNLNQTPINVSINDTIAVELQDSSATFIPIFGGNVTDVTISVADVGAIGYTQRIKIVALGALARLQKVLTNGVLSKDYDGDQIFDVLNDILLNDWSQVAGSATWGGYDPAITWATAENAGLGNIDRPGDYELASRSSSRTDAYSLVSALATSGLGYIYEDATGAISYADSTHRSQYLAANGYVDLSANEAQGNGLTIQTRAGDVRNSITLKYGGTSSSEVSASDSASIATYGSLAQIITTTLEKSADATSQANFYLTLRAYPQANFKAITYQLTNPELSDTDRDALISVFMGMPVSITDLPLNMVAGNFLGFVEGWTFQASYNEISLTMNLSPISYSLQAMAWQDVPITEQWNTLNPTLDYENATIVV